MRPHRTTSGLCTPHGRGVPQDYAEAAKWYRRAAAQGHAGAQFNLGRRYADGRGVPQDYAEAVKWLRRAAEQGLADAQNDLGCMYAQAAVFRRTTGLSGGAHLVQPRQDFTRFAYLTAWRRGELVTLRWSDVDRAGGVIRLRPEQAKNGHGRTVAIEGDLHPIIERRWQARQLEGPGGPVRVVELGFHRRGRPVGDFRKAWAQACTETDLYRVAGINPDGTEKKTPTRILHDLRRSGVRNMVRAGVPERVAMEVSGHRTRSIFDRYNVVSEADLRTAMQRTSAYVNAQPTQSTVTRLHPAAMAVTK